MQWTRFHEGDRPGRLHSGPGGRNEARQFGYRAYLIPLGIPGRSPEDLTPAEVGHLIRFLRMIVPEAMLAVERVTARYGVFAERMAHSVVRLAA